MSDSSNNFQIKAVVITASDTRSEKDDLAGDNLAGCLRGIGAQVIEKIIVTDDKELLSSKLIEYADRGDVNLIITTGGTGFAPRDNTPEATLAVIEKETPGISEALRADSAKHTHFAMISRGMSGIRGKCLIINFPGSPKAVFQCFEVVKKILPHAVKLVTGGFDDEH